MKEKGFEGGCFRFFSNRSEWVLGRTLPTLSNLSLHTMVDQNCRARKMLQNAPIESF